MTSASTGVMSPQMRSAVGEDRPRPMVQAREADAAPQGHSAPHDGFDWRMRALLGESAWLSLPGSVRKRFARPRSELEAVYVGEVVETRVSRAGWVIGWIFRSLGGPSPAPDRLTGPSVVVVAEDTVRGEQSWTRTYVRRGRLPYIVVSRKRFCGPTGLEEYVGWGVGMTLVVSAEDGAVCFRSQRYFFGLGRSRLYLPARLSPGTMEIVHRDEGEGRFSFRLRLAHPRLGCLVEQFAIFRDPVSERSAEPGHATGRLHAHSEECAAMADKSDTSGRGDGKLGETASKRRDENPDFRKGQRDQYSAGYAYRKDDLSRGADTVNEHDWAGGDRDTSTDRNKRPEPGKPETA